MLRFLVVGLLCVVPTCDCSAQHVVIRAPDGAYACGFRTKAGLVTVAHLRGVGGAWANEEYDCRMIKNNSGVLHDVGEGVPKLFRCRRGREHSLTVVRTEKTQWIVTAEFFPGESGLPVFNSKWQVVGYVRGNLVGSVYRGRVGRLRNVPEFRRSMNASGKNLKATKPVDAVGLTDE